MGFLDNFRYPGFQLTSQPQLPSAFGPPNMSSQVQGAIGGLVDPILARLKEQQDFAQAKKFGDQLEVMSRIYMTPTAVTPPGQSSTGSTASSNTADIHAPIAAANPEVRDTFLKTVEAGGLKNPYALAAVAATGQAETSWSPGRVNTAWDDLGKPSGGTLSWRAERLQAMRKFTQGAEDPVAAQAQFFLQENPALIARLNEAKSPEEANALMANAWRYKGFNQPGTGEFAKREALTRQYVAKLGTPAATPQPTPTASFAPQVAPAATPAAAAAVTAPQGQPTMAAPTMPLPQRGPQAQGGIPFQQPQGPQRTMPMPQAQQQPQAPQDQQLAQQQEVIANVGQGNQEITQRLNAERQAGQAARTQVASLDPSAGISPALPGLQLGGVMPGSTQSPPPPPPRAAAVEPSLLDPQPMVPPQFAARPQAPAGPEPAAPAAAAAGAPGPPPPAPAAVPPPPVRVAQLADLPPLVAEQVQRPISPEHARALLNAASTPEQYNAAAQLIMQSRQGARQQGNRFSITHDKEGNWVQQDNLTGATRTARAGGGVPGAVTKEVREAERQLFNDFESTETVKKYRELEQGVQGLKSAFQGGNANADLVAVIQLFKAIDPGSTVTGAESASVRNAAGVPETLRAMFNRGIGEGGQFSPALRAEIFNTAQRMQQSKVQQIEKHAEAYKRRAKAYGLDPDRTVAFEPFKFERAKPEDFPDINQREVPAAPAAPRAPLTQGSSRATPLDVPDMAAAERMMKELTRRAREQGKPVGKTYLRLPPETPGGKPVIAVIEDDE